MPGINLASAHEALEAAHPDRQCLVFRDRILSWRQIGDRSRRVAGALRAAGLGTVVERDRLAGWEKGQDVVALFCHNGNEYLEVMLGAYKARCAPVNVNYRYTADELAYVLRDSQARAVVVDPTLRPVLDEALPSCPAVTTVWEVGAPYEAVLAGAEPWSDPACSPDDLYVLYTGGTTGKPKGVLWRQADFVAGALGITASEPAELVAKAGNGDRLRALPSPPFMHGAAHWNAWSCWLAGGTVLVQSVVTHFDAHDVLTTAATHGATSLQIVGDAFGQPLLDALRTHHYDLGRLRHLTSGGAVLSATTKAALLERLPHVTIMDIVGSSESGRQGVRSSTTASGASTGTFEASAGATVLDDTRTRELAPGADEIGWMATCGPTPLGYLGDPTKSAATFPVVDGRRYSVPGDRARRLADGSIELLGREAVTITTGGEKVFAEEVEQAIKAHPAVYDALVVGRPDPRWGQAVVAVVAPRAGASVTLEELRATASEHLARYKLPKALVLCTAISRSPSGKPDYAWARSLVAATPETQD
jgi:fatty-acyl-CoA synthase